MDLLFQFLDHFVGTDTDPVDLLPLVVLSFMAIGMRYLRSLMLRVLGEIGALRERIDIMSEIRRVADRDSGGPP